MGVFIAMFRGFIFIAGFAFSGYVNAGIIDAGKLVRDARSQIGVTINYDPAYRQLNYPLGDVNIQTGVCTDVVIRAYRGQGVDLQVLVHEDMRRFFGKYPKNWGLKSPDKNIDHRRVPNLQTFFTRHGQSFKISQNVQDYQTGDIVTWKIPPNLPHIGIISERKNAHGVPLVIHNIGAGTQEDDVLHNWPLTGHYRYKIVK